MQNISAAGNLPIKSFNASYKPNQVLQQLLTPALEPCDEATISQKLANLFVTGDYIFTAKGFKDGSYDNPRLSPVCEVFSGLETQQYMCINPLQQSSNRAMANVSAYRNFIFESDVVPLEEQLELLPKIAALNIVRMCLYSGNKSLHFIVSAADTLELGQAGSEEASDKYKAIWSGLAQQFAKLGLICDTAVKHPAALCRVPMAMRQMPDQQHRQQTVVFEGPMLSAQELVKFMQFTVPTKAEIRDYKIASLEHFEGLLGKISSLQYLKREMYNPWWIAAAGVYPEMWRLSLWAIDMTGVSEEVLTKFTEKYILPKLLQAGYHRNPILAIKAAYRYKRGE